MHVLPSFLRPLFIVLGALACWSLTSGTAWAAGDSSSGSGRWVASWFLIGLFTLLGLLSVLRPNGRATEAKVKREE